MVKTDLSNASVRDMLATAISARKSGKSAAVACHRRSVAKGYGASVEDVAFIASVASGQSTRSRDWENELRAQSEARKWRLQA